MLLKKSVLFSLFSFSAELVDAAEYFEEVLLGVFPTATPHNAVLIKRKAIDSNFWVKIVFESLPEKQTLLISDNKRIDLTSFNNRLIIAAQISLVGFRVVQSCTDTAFLDIFVQPTA